ncbi:hypothetical protein ACFOOP_11100 [Marinicaulis aureus]|uniref:Oxaloacetate decarboxylase n=1 Tax=Hyphococcus aureus TaxID=2666033 RepID=A0ABW1KZT4_9PROT
MDRNHIMTDGWMMMGPFGGVVSLLVLAFLILGIAAFVKYLFFDSKK